MDAGLLLVGYLSGISPMRDKFWLQKSYFRSILESLVKRIHMIALVIE